MADLLTAASLGTNVLTYASRLAPEDQAAAAACAQAMLRNPQLLSEAQAEINKRVDRMMRERGLPQGIGRVPDGLVGVALDAEIVNLSLTAPKSLAKSRAYQIRQQLAFAQKHMVDIALVVDQLFAGYMQGIMQDHETIIRKQYEALTKSTC